MKYADLTALQEQVDVLATNFQNFTESTKITFNQLTEFVETVQDQISSTKTALAELTRRIDERDQSEKPDDSKRACHEHFLDGFTTDGTCVCETKMKPIRGSLPLPMSDVAKTKFSLTLATSNINTNIPKLQV